MGLRKPCLTICLLLLFVPARSQGAQNIQLVGVGSTTPIAIYSLWFREFEKAHPHVHFSYIPSGSSDGVDDDVFRRGRFWRNRRSHDERPACQGRSAAIPRGAGGAGAGLQPAWRGVRSSFRSAFWPGSIWEGSNAGTIRPWYSSTPKRNCRRDQIVVFHSAAGRGSAYVWSDFLSKVSAGMANQGWHRRPYHMANRHCGGRERQSGGRGQAHAGFHWLCVVLLCRRARPGLRASTKCRGEVRDARFRQHGRVRGRGEHDACRLPPFDHQLSGRTILPNRKFYVAASPQEAGERGEAGGDASNFSLGC